MTSLSVRVSHPTILKIHCKNSLPRIIRMHYFFILPKSLPAVVWRSDDREDVVATTPQDCQAPPGGHDEKHNEGTPVLFVYPSQVVLFYCHYVDKQNMNKYSHVLHK